MAKTPQPNQPGQPPPTQPTFEESMQKLEEIVRQLEEGELGLSESLQRYEEGVACLRACQSAVADAESKIELLFRIDADGNPHTEPFAEEDMTLEEKQASRSRRRSHAEDKENDSDVRELF